MAATEPVTPSSTLATLRLLMLLFENVEQSTRQVGPRHLFVPTCIAEEGPIRCAFERVGHHPIRVRLTARLFRNRQQFAVAQADFQLEFHKQTAIVPLLANLIYELRRAHQAQPQFRLIALDFPGGAIEQCRSFLIIAPGEIVGMKARARRRSEDARGAIIADGGTMYDGVLHQASDVMVHQRFEIFEAAVAATLPALL